MAKTTKNTEDKELADLEATFATDDSPMTQFTEEGTAEAEQGSPKEEQPKKKSSNLMIYAIGGTVAAALIGYKVMGAMNAQTPIPDPVQTQQQVAQQQTPAPVIPPPVQQQPQPPVQQPLVTGAENTQQGNTMMQPPQIDLNASQAQMNPPVVNPNIVQPQPVKQGLPNNLNQNGNSVASINELKDAFNAQNSEFKTVLTDVGSHLEKIDGELAKQQDVNKGFDKRITALEKGKPRRVESSGSGSSKALSNPKQRQGNILIDKSQQRANFEMQEREVAAPTKMVDNTPQPKLMSNGNQGGAESMRQSISSLEVHTIYSGRVWIKNPDNTLSTYAAGDTLPTGEVIKSVDNEKLEVKTNRRVIKAQ